MKEKMMSTTEVMRMIDLPGHADKIFAMVLLCVCVLFCVGNYKLIDL
jgi:hypothetical protein